MDARNHSEKSRNWNLIPTRKKRHNVQRRRRLTCRLDPERSAKSRPMRSANLPEMNQPRKTFGYREVLGCKEGILLKEDEQEESVSVALSFRRSSKIMDIFALILL